MGPAPHEEDGACVADDADADTDTDADTDADSDTDADTDTDTDTDAQDADGDGYTAPEDCDENDAEVNPGATEVCANYRDDDCDGTAGECAWSGDEGADEWGVALDGALGSDVTGWDVGGGGDANGDGYDDLLVGGWGTDSEGSSGDGGSRGVTSTPTATPTCSWGPSGRPPPTPAPSRSSRGR